MKKLGKHDFVIPEIFNVPEWAKYLTIDEDGVVTLHQWFPEPQYLGAGGIWSSDGLLEEWDNPDYINIGFAAFNPNWDNEFYYLTRE